MSYEALIRTLAEKGVKADLVKYATGFEDAVLGHTLVTPAQLIYSKQRMLGILVGQGMAEEAAEKLILNLVADGMGSFDRPIVIDETFLQNIEN